MAKFNIEVELDWMDEEAYSIDDELRERIVKGVENALLEKATNEAVKAVDNKIAEKILEAEETIQATVDQFIANVCEEKILFLMMIAIQKTILTRERKESRSLQEELEELAEPEAKESRAKKRRLIHSGST